MYTLQDLQDLLLVPENKSIRFRSDFVGGFSILISDILIH